MQSASPGMPATLTTKVDSPANQTTIVKNDEIPLEQINSIIKAGETEELQEGFNVWSLGALLVCLMATWEALATVVASALTNGGPPCLFYNYIISFLGTLALAASMAEMASMFPTV